VKSAQAGDGRLFVIRLEQGEVIHEAIEAFCRREGIGAAVLSVVGGAEDGSRLVVGPADGNERPVRPMTAVLRGVHEVTGTGTVFPDEAGNPLLHLHLACGRGESTVTGCAREGVTVWQVLEVVLREITGTDSARLVDADTGFALLVPRGGVGKLTR